ncbi:MAG: hypothetical protein ACI865_000308 [Flavobacteriaceae bacterium]|jgi:hypothetical protein
MSKRNFTIGTLAVICSTLLFSCVTEETISTSDLPGGENERRARLDSAQQIRTVEAPKKMLFTEPANVKGKKVKGNQ